MNSRLKQILSLVVISAISLGIMMLLISMKTTPKRKPAQDNRPVISALTVQNHPIQLTVPVIGRLRAHEKIILLAEVSGVLEPSRKEFLTGQSYQRGEILLTVNQEETELALKAQRSNLLTAIAALLPELKFNYPQSYNLWNAYLQSFDIEATTRPLPQSSNEREKFFVANKGIYNSYYQIKSQEVRLGKFTIRAPFDGVLIQSNITPGNLVRIGQPLGTFIDPTTYDLETTTSPTEINQIRIGDPVHLVSDNIEGNWIGKVVRINPAVDANSERVKVFVTVSAPDLRDGMFLRGDIQTSARVVGVELPRKLLHNGKSILAIIDGSIHYRDVEVVSTRGEMAVVTGLPDGLLLSTKTQNLFDGMSVKIPGEQSKYLSQEAEKTDNKKEKTNL